MTWNPHPDTAPDWQSREAQAALDWMAAHPAVSYPLTREEQIREDYTPDNPQQEDETDEQ